MKPRHRAPLHLTLFERKTVLWTGWLQGVAAQQLSMLHVPASHLVFREGSAGSFVYISAWAFRRVAQ